MMKLNNRAIDLAFEFDSSNTLSKLGSDGISNSIGN